MDGTMLRISDEEARRRLAKCYHLPKPYPQIGKYTVQALSKTGKPRRVQIVQHPQGLEGHARIGKRFLSYSGFTWAFSQLLDKVQPSFFFPLAPSYLLL